MDAQVDRDQSKTDKQTPPPRKAVIVRFLRALKRQYHRYEAEAKKRQSDHTENERVMALWTKRVGQFTIALSFIAAASAGISYWSLLAIQGQLDEMRSSGEDTKSLVKAAQDSAKAAQDALSVAEKNSRRQLRAYLAMLHPKLSMGDSQLRFDFSFRNAGQTPAHDVGVAIKATIVDARKRQVIHINRDAPMLFPKFVIGRDLEETGFIEFDLTSGNVDTIPGLKSGESTVSILFDMQYRDIFMDTHRCQIQFGGARKEDGAWDLLYGKNDSSECD